MSLSNITLPVSHLPRSSSFFLSALQPLGYRYLDHRDDRHIGFGVEEPDFWLCQDNPEPQAGAADITFSAPSPAAVDAFYTAALRAGGSSHTPPTQRQSQYRAGVLDLDGNLVEVVWTESNSRALGDRRSLVGPARTTVSSSVLSWQKDVARSISDCQSVMAPSRATARPEPARATSTPKISTEAKTNGADFSTTKALIGTLLGAAGGAAVAYAMMRAESEDELERERAASREAPTHQIMMVDREVDARRSDVGGGARSIVSGSGSKAPPASTTVVGGGGSKVGSKAPTTTQPTPAEQARSAIGTLISTFIPPSTVPRLLEAPPPATNKPSTPAASAVGSVSTAKPPQNNTPSSSSSSAVTAREIPLPPSARASTVVTARDVPLPASSRTTTVSMARSVAGTVTPSESISNAGSRRSHKSVVVVGGGGGGSTTHNTNKAGSRSGSRKPSPSPSPAKTEKTIKPASITGGGSSHHSNGGGNGGGSTTTTKNLAFRTGPGVSSSSSASAAAGKKKSVISSSASKPSPLRRESAS